MSDKIFNMLLYGCLMSVSAYATTLNLAIDDYVATAFPGLVFMASTWVFCQNVVKLNKENMKAFAQSISTVFASLFGAYVFTILWGWFAVVIFGAPVITIPMALGIALLVRYYTWQSSPEQASDEHQAHQRVVAWVKPVTCLLVGWAVKFFM